MSIHSILQKKSSAILTIDRKATVLDAIQKMVGSNVGSILILDGEELVGIFTERDLLRLCAWDVTLVGYSTIEEVMTRNVVVASPEDEIEDILATMTERKFRHMPIMDDHTLRGIVSIGDAVKHKLELVMGEVKLLKEYIRG